MNSLFCFFFQRPTALAKIVGAFRIGFRNNQTNNDLKQDLLVMENLFYNCSISQVRFVIVLNESSMRLWMIIYFIYSFQEKRTEYWRFFFLSPDFWSQGLNEESVGQPVQNSQVRAGACFVGRKSPQVYVSELPYIYNY